MTSPSENQTSLSDAERTRHRLEIFNELFRGLLLVSGGGVVALFAFLQAVGSNSALVRVILVGILILSMSLVSSLLFMKFRYDTSLFDQFRIGVVEAALRRERSSLFWAIAFIGVAILVLALGTWIYL